MRPMTIRTKLSKISTAMLRRTLCRVLAVARKAGPEDDGTGTVENDSQALTIVGLRRRAHASIALRQDGASEVCGGTRWIPAEAVAAAD